MTITEILEEAMSLTTRFFWRFVGIRLARMSVGLAPELRPSRG